MKNILLAILCLIAVFSCSKEDTDLDYILRARQRMAMKDQITPYFHNNPLPQHTDRLRVLAIGNSYTVDGTEYIGQILSCQPEVPDTAYCVYRIVHPNASLDYWYDSYTSLRTDSMLCVAGDMLMPTRYGTVAELLSHPWDVVVFQQQSALSVNYETYTPSLYRLIDAVRVHCTNPNVAIAWQMVHTYWYKYKNNNNPRGAERWNTLCLATQLMIADSGIDIVIPTATAIQNARNTSLQTEHDLTRDGTHLSFGVGRYVAACTWIQTLFSPVFRFSVLGNPACHELYAWERSSKECKYSDSAQPVTDLNRELCQQCAVSACRSPYELVIP